MDARSTRSGRGLTPLSRALSAVVCAGAVLAAGACSSAVNPGTPGLSAPYASATPSTVPATLAAGEDPADLLTEPPPFSASRDPAVSDPSSGAMLTVTDIRISHHDGFDRVVYELDGSGVPGWTVGYVSQAVEEASGMVLEIDGRATLWVALTGSGYPSETGAVPFSHPTSVRGAGTTVVTEVEGWSAFEGTTGSFIGVAEQELAFRVFLLDHPLRVVVDIEEPRT